MFERSWNLSHWGAIKTCDLALEAADQLYVPVTKSWRLNERMYGALTGLDKKENVGWRGIRMNQYEPSWLRGQK